MWFGGVDRFKSVHQAYADMAHWDLVTRGTVALVFLGFVFGAIPALILRLTVLRHKTFFRILLFTAAVLSLFLSLNFAADHHYGFLGA